MKILWDEKACCHSGNCVKSLPEVFKVLDGKFVIEPDNANAEQIRKVVDACPGKALKIS